MNYLQNKLLPDFWQSIKSRHIWMHMATRDVKNRFRGTVAGMGWMFFSLLTLTGSITLVYGTLLGMSLGEFAPFLILGLILWNFLTTSSVDGAFAFVQAQGYILQINFPKQVYILRCLWSSLLMASPGLLIYPLLILLLLPVKWGILWFFPGLALLIIATTGHVWIFAYLTARYRDIPHAISVIFQILYFLTPVLYPPELLAKRGLAMVYMVNPFYWLLEMVREPLLHFKMADPLIYWLAIGYCCLIWILALWIGVKLDRKVVYYL